MNLLTMDIGGSSIKVAVLDENATIIERDRLEIADSFDGMMDTIANNFMHHNKSYDLKGLALSAPGSVDPETGIIGGASAIPYIHGPNWIEILEKRLNVSVSIENDANCAALAEAHYGDHKDAKTMSFVVIGSGIGGANVLDGKVLPGAHSHGGEFGYMILRSDEMHLDSFSELGSVGGLIRDAKRRGLNAESGIEIFDLHKQGHEIATQCVTSFFKYLGVGIFNVQYVYDPEIILLAGAISEMPGFEAIVTKSIEDVVSNHGSATLYPRVAIATFGQDSNLVGAMVNYKMRVGLL